MVFTVNRLTDTGETKRNGKIKIVKPKPRRKYWIKQAGLTSKV